MTHTEIHLTVMSDDSGTSLIDADQKLMSRKRKLGESPYESDGINAVKILFKEEPRDVPVSLTEFNTWYDQYFPDGKFDFCQYRAVPAMIARIFSKFPIVSEELRARYAKVASSLIERWEESQIDMKSVIGEMTHGHGEAARRKFTRILMAMLNFHYIEKEFDYDEWMDIHRSVPGFAHFPITEEQIYRHIICSPLCIETKFSVDIDSVCDR